MFTSGFPAEWRGRGKRVKEGWGMKAQWDCFLQNLGIWEGSFTSLSPTGEVVSDTPSRLVLEGLDADNREVRLTLQRQGKPDTVLHFTTIGGGGLMFFETGSFSQGALLLSSYAQFGAELALVHGDRRLRLVQLFNPSGQLQEITLIREQRSGSQAPERPPLQLNDLLGEWQGEAITLYPDFHTTTCATRLIIQQPGETQLEQQLSFGAGDKAQTIRSTANISGSILKFDQGALPVQVMLLPDGASANCPTEVRSGHPFVLEAGWLLEPGLRQRLVRSYNSKGEWVSLTLVTERKLS